MQYVCNISLPVLPNWLESVRLNIGFPVVRTDGRAVYGHVITKFSGMGRFTYSWCSVGALRALELRYENHICELRSEELCEGRSSQLYCYFLVIRLVNLV